MGDSFDGFCDCVELLFLGLFKRGFWFDDGFWIAEFLGVTLLDALLFVFSLFVVEFFLFIIFEYAHLPVQHNIGVPLFASLLGDYGAFGEYLHSE